MVFDVQIGKQPIGFRFKLSDIVKVDEKNKTIHLSELISRTYKDTIDDNDPETEDIVIQNTFKAVRLFILPYENVEAQPGVTLLEDIKESIRLQRNRMYSVQGNVESISLSKVVVSNDGDLTVYAETLPPEQN